LRTAERKEEVAEQLLEPIALLADEVDLGPGPPVPLLRRGGGVGLGKILRQELHVESDR
jgi:hypothetical protein